MRASKRPFAPSAITVEHVRAFDQEEPFGKVGCEAEARERSRSEFRDGRKSHHFRGT
jgi:hypothetical protein